MQLESGPQKPAVVFVSTTGYRPYDPESPINKELNARSAAMNAANDAALALEAAERAKPVVIEPEAEPEETLERVIPPPEDPATFGGGGRGR